MTTTALETGLYNALKNSSALTTELGGTLIYNKLAPQGTTGAYVVFQWQGGGPENDTPRESKSVLYTVRAIADTQAKAATVAGLIDNALHKQTLSISGHSNYWTAREQDLNLLELTAGAQPKYHVGGIYRISYDKS